MVVSSVRNHTCQHVCRPVSLVPSRNNDSSAMMVNVLSTIKKDGEAGLAPAIPIKRNIRQKAMLKFIKYSSSHRKMNHQRNKKPNEHPSPIIQKTPHLAPTPQRQPNAKKLSHRPPYIPTFPATLFALPRSTPHPSSPLFLPPTIHYPNLRDLSTCDREFCSQPEPTKINPESQDLKRHTFGSDINIDVGTPFVYWDFLYEFGVCGGVCEYAKRFSFSTRENLILRTRSLIFTMANRDLSWSIAITLVF